MSDTPRTDATCKAIAAMLEPLRGGTRVTNAEMKAVQGTIEAIAKCSADLERDLARVTAEKAGLDDEIVKYAALLERMTEKLGKTCDAMKGQPEALRLHSWHDLPEVAEAVKASLFRARQDNGILRTELARVKSRAEAAEADARRYRWLREFREPRGAITVLNLDEDTDAWIFGEHLDAAIDAAIEAREG